MSNADGFNPETGEWNDSLTGNYLWGNTNIGETMSDVVTPFTWSLVSAWFEQINVMPGYPLVGNIAGRAYNNISVLVSAMHALGKNINDLNKEMGGVRDEYKDNLSKIIIPLPKPPFFPLLRRGFQIRKGQIAGIKKIPAFLAGNRDFCRSVHQSLLQLSDPGELSALLRDEIIPYSMDKFWMVVGSAFAYGEHAGKLRRELTGLVGAEDTDKLLSNVSNEIDLLASLGPAIGLARVARGKMSREEYIEEWGHRGPHESELITPRPGEDPDWLELQLAALEHAPVDAEALLVKRRTEFDKAWERFQERFPRKAKTIQRRLAKTAEAARLRELVRSEMVRGGWVTRAWALRAGELTGLRDDIFFLTTEEAIDLLEGQDAIKNRIPARRKMYARYKALPPYPMIIRGEFDPFQWAADPERRTDFHDPEGIMLELFEKAEREDPTRSNKVLGAPGSAGVVEGIVRRLDSPEQAKRCNPARSWSPRRPISAGRIFSRWQKPLSPTLARRSRMPLSLPANWASLLWLAARTRRCV